MSETTKTDLFEIYFSKDKKGKDNKFRTEEKKNILEAVRKIEQTLLNVSSFSRTAAINEIYRIPVIFEKVSKETFLAKHTNHQAMTSYPPIGSIWNKTILYKGIEVKSKTAVISLCPIKTEEIGETVIHELIHAYSNSFLDDDGVNHNNKTYFLEVIAEFFTKIASRERKIS